MVLTIPDDGLPNPKGPWFTIKEGSKYTLVFNFHVTNNIVSGLRYNNTVWKTGVKGTKFNRFCFFVVVTNVYECYFLFICLVFFSCLSSG